VNRGDLLSRAAELANEFLDGVGKRPAGGPAGAAALRAAIRISVSTWSTMEEDADRSVAAILAAADRVRDA
jgi:hypothetical protein